MKNEARRIRLRRLLLGAVLFVSTVVLFEFSYRLYGRGGTTHEFCHYAEIASNILEGRGFTTRSFFPSHLAQLKRAGAAVGETGPIVDRFPLFAYWSALWLKIGGGGDFGMALGNGAAHAFWVVVVFWIGTALFGEAAALCAAALWAAHPLLLGGFDLKGYPDVLFGALVDALCFLWWRHLAGTPAPARWGAFGAGALAAAAALTRQNLVLWLPLFLAAPFAAGRRGAWRAAASFAAGFLCLYLPWTLFYLRQNGFIAPSLLVENLAFETLVPSLPWTEYRTYAFGEFLSPHVLKLLLLKSFCTLNLFLKDLPAQWLQFPLFPFALMGMAAAAGLAGGLAAGLGALLLWQAALLSFLRRETLGALLPIPGGWAEPATGRYFLWFAPFVILYAADFLIKKRGSRPWRLAGLLIAALTLEYWAGTYALLNQTSPRQAGGVAAWPELAYIRQATPPDSWIATNLSAQVSWYTGRRTVFLPSRPEDLGRLCRDWPVDRVYLSFRPEGEPENLPAWTSAAANRSDRGLLPSLRTLGFEPERSFPDGLLLRRRAGGGGPR